MTFWIGLTGGIGSGKSSIAQMFAELGVPIIDADAISRSLTTENGEALPAIRQLFGDEVFDSEGRLNRIALREEVFRRPQSINQILPISFLSSFPTGHWQSSRTIPTKSVRSRSMRRPAPARPAIQSTQ